MVLIVLLLLGLILFFILKPYFIKYDTIICFTGGLGSGKSFNSSNVAVNLLKRMRFKIWIYNHLPWNRKRKKERPQLYSNIPVRIGFFENARVLKDEHLLLQERLPEKSIVYIDEIDQFANQLEFRNPNLARLKDGSGGAFDEFCRFFRHYTKGGYLVINTQCSDNIVLNVRRRFNTFFNLFHFRAWGIPLIWPNIIYSCKIRNMSLSEDVKVIEEGNTEDNMRNLIGFFPLFRRYDTYCYSERYATVPDRQGCLRWHRMKLNEMIVCPATVKHAKTDGVNRPGTYKDARK